MLCYNAMGFLKESGGAVLYVHCLLVLNMQNWEERSYTSFQTCFVQELSLL